MGHQPVLHLGEKPLAAIETCALLMGVPRGFDRLRSEPGSRHQGWAKSAAIPRYRPMRRLREFTARRGSASTRVWLAVIVAGAILLAGIWVFLVPIYENPDEPQHLDYVLSVASAGRLLNARERPTLPSGQAIVGHPDANYLLIGTDFARVHQHPDQTMAAGYGTPSYYATLDRLAPAGALFSGPPDKNPGLLTFYPFGYYALAAAVVWVVGHVVSSVSAVFFAARLLSVVLLALGLLLTYSVARELGVAERGALLYTALIGFFPMTTFVASAVQPDNLSFVLVALAVYLALLARRHGQAAGWLWGLGITLGLLLATKFQFFLCLAPVLYAAGLTERRFRTSRSSWQTALVALSLPVIALYAVHLWVVAGSRIPVGTQASVFPNTAYFDQELAGGVGSFLAYIAMALGGGLREYFLGGQSFTSFWGIFGWMDTPIQFGSVILTSIVRATAMSWTLLTLVLIVMQLAQVGRRLVRVALHRHGWLALRLALSDPFLCSYVLFTIFMFGLFVITDGSFFPQGRNWFPFLLPTWMVALRYAPRVFKSAGRRVAYTRLTATGLATYCAAGGVFALLTVTQRFYGGLPWR
jgi:4-amino-4-deoxy-L-arabinose transferase-like glycosyltransferase